MQCTDRCAGGKCAAVFDPGRSRGRRHPRRHRLDCGQGGSGNGAVDDQRASLNSGGAAIIVGSGQGQAAAAELDEISLAIAADIARKIELVLLVPVVSVTPGST